jgi:DNA-binding GntR family transcriptional regulator
MIINGDLEPGAIIREGELSERLDISKSPLREALRQLHQDGLIITVSNKGSRVAPLTEDDIREIYKLREYTEALAARLASERRTPEDLASLRANIAALELGVQDGRVREVAEHDIEFHLLLAHAARHRRLQRIQESLQSEMLRLVMRQFADWGEVAETDAVRKHTAIVDAVEAGDGDAAEAHIRAHIRQGEEFRRAALARNHGSHADGRDSALISFDKSDGQRAS